MYGRPRGTCSHVAMLRLSSSSVRVVRYQRLQRTGCHNHASYKQLNEIDFTGAASLKRTFDCSIVTDEDNSTPQQLSTRKVVSPPLEERVQAFFQNLGKLNTKPAILSLLPDYSGSYVPDVLQCDLPIVLTELYEECAQDLEFNDLLTKCNVIKIDVSPAQAAHVEAITREQSSNRL